MTPRAPLAALLLCLLTPSASGEPAPFDLVGPTLEVDVTHAGKTLPIAETPNLSPADRVSIKADLPPDQSVHYLLVAAFLRGAINPPPKKWFHRADTWTREGRAGLNVVVPKNAEQLVVMLAPETGGDFRTLVDTVRGRPGIFVRASQDLNQIALDRSRLDAFLRGVRKRGRARPDKVANASATLARSLAIQLNDDCLRRAPAMQSMCLTQNPGALLLDDQHSTSISDALAAGGSSLAFDLSATPQAGFGYYSPYIAAVKDIVGILGSFNTATYQYIPALGAAQGDKLPLLLNAAPSFHNPKSVLVAALPAIQAPVPPPLEAVAAPNGLCAQQPGLVLPVDGAPLIFSTDYTHDMTLRLKAPNGKTIDLPVTADAAKGGFAVDASGFGAAGFSGDVDGRLHGYWGFQPFDGPTFHLANARASTWRAAPQDPQSAVHLEGGAAACVESVALRRPSGETERLPWKIESADRIAVTLPADSARAGPPLLLITQYGVPDPQVVTAPQAPQALNQ